MPLPDIQSQRRAHLVAIAVVSLLFAASTVLCIYSDARVSIAVGDRDSALWERIPLWTSMILQPWIILALMIESLCGIYFMTTSLAGSVVAAVLSGVILYLILRWAVSRFGVAGWVVLGVLVVLAGFNIHWIVTDMRVVSAVGGYSGP